MMCDFKTSSNPIALKLMVGRSFLDYWSLNHHSNIWSCYLSPYFGCTFQPMFNCVCFSSSIHHYTFWSDKCYLLVHIIVEIHPLEISMICRWVHQPPPHPLLGLLMNFCFRTRFHNSFPENLMMSSRQFVLHLSSQASWVWVIPTPIRSESRPDMTVGTYFHEI